MYDEPDNPGEGKQDDVAAAPQQRVAEKVESLKTHSQLAAVFEGHRKFGHEVNVGLDSGVARDVQKSVAQLEQAKLKLSKGPLLPPESFDQARDLLTKPAELKLACGDYHVYRRPGETMIMRWLDGEQTDVFYERLQAHFDAALAQTQEDERNTHGWRGDEETTSYLDLLDNAKQDMPAWFLRPIIKQHRFYVLSTITADEMNIDHLAGYLMGITAAELVGSESAPGGDYNEEGPSDADKAWYFKLYCLRGMPGQQERMCYFAFLQKASDDLW